METNVTLQTTTDCGLSNCAMEQSGGSEHREYASRFMPHIYIMMVMMPMMIMRGV